MEDQRNCTEQTTKAPNPATKKTKKKSPLRKKRRKSKKIPQQQQQQQHHHRANTSASNFEPVPKSSTDTRKSKKNKN